MINEKLSTSESAFPVTESFGREPTVYDVEPPAAEREDAMLSVPVVLNLSDITTQGYEPLSKRELVIGRDDDCDIVLDDHRASRRHVSLVVSDVVPGPRQPEVTLIDHDSMNGTYVNGEEVAGQRLLRNGDRILVGATEFGYFVRTKLEVELEQRHRALLRERGYVPADSRVPVDLDVALSIVFPEETFSPTSIDAKILDISRRGARLSSRVITRNLYSMMLRSKRYVRIEARIRGSKESILLRGQLVWIHYEEKGEATNCSFGVCFDAGDRKSRGLVDYLAVRFAPSEDGGE